MRPPAYWEPRFGWRMLDAESREDLIRIDDWPLVDLKRVFARRARVLDIIAEQDMSVSEFILAWPGILILEFEDRQCGFVHDTPRAATWYHMNVTQELLREMEEEEIASSDAISYVHDAAGDQNSLLAGLPGARVTATAIYKLREIRSVLRWKDRFLGLHFDDGAGGGIVLGNYLRKQKLGQFSKTESALQVYSPAEIAPENIEETIRIN